MLSQAAIEIRALEKIYKGSDERALNGVSLVVPRGEIFGLLGPNGAGKTTTINILCGILSATSGSVKVSGLEIGRNGHNIKHIIGVVPQEIALYPSLTARENLDFIGSMYGLNGKLLKERINQGLSLFGLEKYANRQVSSYSGGMKRRLNLISGILHQPRILFLDEPTVGIDVQSRTVIIEYLKKLNEDGMTIIYTSHYLEEAEQLCSLIAIIDQGKIIAQGKPEVMIAENPGCQNLEGIFLHLTGRKLRDQ